MLKANEGEGGTGWKCPVLALVIKLLLSKAASCSTKEIYGPKE